MKVAFSFVVIPFAVYSSASCKSRFTIRTIYVPDV
jgi:hypothetical protein